MHQHLFLHEYDDVWDRFVGPDVTPTVKNEGKYLSEPGNLYVLKVNFYNLQGNGAIRIENSDDKSLLTSKTYFCDSKASSNGGSLYVTNGKCIQYHVCSINSYSSNSGCHSYVDTNKENYVIESSFSQHKGYESALYMIGGNQIIDSSNISYAKCDWNAAYVCYGSPTSHMINFTSIFNNSAKEQCIMFQRGNSHYISKCKIIQNELQKNSDQKGIIYNAGCDLEVIYCIFSLNYGPFLFSNPNSNNKFLIDKCFIDSNNVVDHKSPNFVSLTTTNYLVFNLRHLSTQDCFAEFPILIKIDQKTVLPIQNPFVIIFVFIYIPCNSLS